MVRVCLAVYMFMHFSGMHSSECHTAWFCDTCIEMGCLWCEESYTDEQTLGRCRDPLLGGCTHDLFLTECPLDVSTFVEWDYLEFGGVDLESQSFVSSVHGDVWIEGEMCSGRNQSLSNTSLYWGSSPNFQVATFPEDDTWSLGDPIEMNVVYTLKSITGTDVETHISIQETDPCEDHQQGLIVSVSSVGLCNAVEDCGACVSNEISGCSWCNEGYCFATTSNTTCGSSSSFCDVSSTIDDDVGEAGDVSTIKKIGIIAMISTILASLGGFGYYMRQRVKMNQRYKNKKFKPGAWRMGKK